MPSSKKAIKEASSGNQELTRGFSYSILGGMSLIPRKVHLIAANLVRIEAAFLASLGIYLVVRTLSSEVQELDAVIAEIVFLFVGSVGLFFAGRGFSQQRYYGRGATVLANLIAIGVAYYMIDGERDLLGFTLGVFALATLIAAIAAVPNPSNHNSDHQGTTS